MHSFFMGVCILNLMLATYNASRGDGWGVVFNLACAGLCFVGAWRPAWKVGSCPHSIGRGSQDAPIPCSKPTAPGHDLCQRHVEEREAILNRNHL